MSDSLYLNWVRGNRVSLYAGITQSQEVAGYQFSGDYIDMYVPLAEIYKPSTEEVITEVQANTRAILIPTITLAPKRYRVQIEPNPALFEVADVQCASTSSEEDPVQARVYAKFYKNFNPQDLEYLVKLRIAS